MRPSSAGVIILANIGNGTTSSLTPVSFAGLTNVLQISTGVATPVPSWNQKLPSAGEAIVPGNWETVQEVVLRTPVQVSGLAGVKSSGGLVVVDE